jgi:hypothetical protein
MSKETITPRQAKAAKTERPSRMLSMNLGRVSMDTASPSRSKEKISVTEDQQQDGQGRAPAGQGGVAVCLPRG